AAGGVLGVDIGSSAASVAAGFNGKLSLHTYPQFGLGETLGALLQHTDIESIMRWLPLDIPAPAVRDYLFQKSLYPSIIPATVEEQAVAQAVTRQNLYLAMQASRRDFPSDARAPRPDLMPLFELIIAGGGALADAPTLGQSLLLLLDAIQPAGFTHFMLDRAGLLPLLGVSAELNNILPVQALESGAFQNLGTAISVVANAAYGTPVLRARMVDANKNESNIEVKYGGLEAFPLGPGESATLSLQPLNRADAGFGPGRAQTVTVGGGALGVVIDARGRPLQLTDDPVRRRDLMKKWLWTLGG
ncbi:MAG: glutamate mutase L, partial [Chloroflexota bacterium]